MFQRERDNCDIEGAHRFARKGTLVLLHERQKMWRISALCYPVVLKKDDVEQMHAIFKNIPLNIAVTANHILICQSC